MKSIKILSLLTCVLLTSFSCTKKDVINDGPVSPIVTSGGWHVSLFSERGKDETSDFNGWNFTFQTDGKLIATKGGTTRQGTWSENTSSKKLNIDLGAKTDANKPLGELTDDWVLITYTTNKISLTDDNSSREELLEFTRH